VEITKEVTEAHYFYHGRSVVGTEAVPVCPKLTTSRNILLKSKSTNTSEIYIGRDNVSADDGESVGFPIGIGQSMTIPADDGSRIYAIASDVDQVLYWCGI
jgi:hypothetical protein